MLFLSASIYASDVQPLNLANKKNQTAVKSEQNVENYTLMAEYSQLSTKKNVKEYEFPKTEGVLCRATVSGTTSSGVHYRVSGSCRKVKKFLESIQ